MNRSTINAILRAASAFIRERGFHLPPFAYWTLEEWRTRGAECAEIVDNRLGWDVTDFGTGDFAHTGLTLFTLRNGNPRDPARKPYAEKILVVEEGQVTPLHFHWRKTEDIINRGGGALTVQLYASTSDERLDESQAITVSIDGIRRTVAAGSIVRLQPGESITLPPRLYHAFWGDTGRVLVGEVSSLNDDASDNRFLHPIGRFPAIDEDEPPLYLLCTDYERFSILR
ncbi:MAG: D-lyxose/D-mannose family sugar isomerase [Roseiflexus sp.]|nr:D-lyxose/D-mannose family sugar isomerase [Roseiflexus sp.]MCS7289193.1 D-lyxose/D-mannose family sugar isomerase [Roseiflexus sp.]MDW8144763.1 D-lyxose/D-mannose family sugar isomerase [Roseiflexaceae bacterium]MDW8232194.1 D-lyxose/D-mannose family sugar isomerase [Roseiflexaceae bacterium]